MLRELHLRFDSGKYISTSINPYSQSHPDFPPDGVEWRWEGKKAWKWLGLAILRPSSGIDHQEMFKVCEKIIIDQARDKKHQLDPIAEVIGGKELSGRVVL